MSYASPKDVLSRHPNARIAEVTDKAGEKVQSARVKVAVEDASAEIDSYLRKVCKLPLASPPPVLKRLAVDIAIYRLMSLLPKESVEDARRRYEDAIKWLEALVEGEIQLDGVGGDESATSGPGRVSYAAGSRVFDEAGLKGFL